MNLFLLMLFILALCSCATSPPRNQQNICSIFKEKHQWKNSISQASNRWRIPAHTVMAIIYNESKFEADAKPPYRKLFGIIPTRRISSAYGYSQALDGTWSDYRRRTGNWNADRDEFDDSADFIGWYLNHMSSKLKIPRNDAYLLYLAYHEGYSGFKRKSYKNKWPIKRYARTVQKQAVMYKHQLRSCPLSPIISYNLIKKKTHAIFIAPL